MSTSLYLTVFNIVTGMGYIGFALFIMPKFDAAAPTIALRLFKILGLLFFTMCAITHINEAIHIHNGVLPEEYWNEPLYIIHMAIQAIAVIGALVIAIGFISIRIFDKTYYIGLLDRGIDEESRRIAERLAGERNIVRLEDLALQSKRAADGVQMIVEAMKKNG